MDESAPVRALTIGVSVFMAIATITAVMLYYNTAKNTAGVVAAKSTDIEGSYRQDIEDSLLSKSEITGTDVINILNYFYKNTNFQINVGNIKFIENGDTGYTCTDTGQKKICTITEISNINNIEDDSKFQTTLKRILPNQKFQVNVDEPNENGIRVITLTGK